jgi:hypothetical protein
MTYYCASKESSWTSSNAPDVRQTSGSDTSADRLRRWLGHVLSPGRRQAATPSREPLGTMCFGPLDPRARLGLHAVAAVHAAPGHAPTSEEPESDGARRPG